MATSTTIQYLSASGISELGATVAVGAGTSNRSQIETFIAGAAIAVGDIVAFDTSATGASRVLTVVKCPATLGLPNIVGVALEAATAAGQIINVVVAGYVETVNATAAIATGTAVTTSGAVAGRVITYDSTAAAQSNASPIGITLGAVVANVVPMWIFKKF
jgi:hypothetical protein